MPTAWSWLPYLVIVESPAKAKTIQKYLWAWYEVTASMWHIADLPQSGMGIAIDDNFTPQYEVSEWKTKVVQWLKKALKSSRGVMLATDEDREWEAIARHICRLLGLDVAKTPRIVFHEITKDAIQHAIAHPRHLDMDLVQAQQARRVLDRLVWFELSPVLRKKVKPQLSAGRVQSVAVRVLVEREREIQQFVPQWSFVVKWQFLNSAKEQFEAELNTHLPDKNAVEEVLGVCRTAAYVVKDINKTPGTRNPSAPFTTSTLQQEASRRLWYAVKTTMQLAQRLYEAGLITYMRTDSVALSSQALGAAKSYITSRFGDTYHQVRQYSGKVKNAQEAHEAIRPTDLQKERAGADEMQKKLYHLIWQRTVASQMASARLEKTTAHIDFGHKKLYFAATGEVIIFDGFLKVYGKDSGDEEHMLPVLHSWESLARKDIVAEETFTKAPARYTEATLVKKLEELGIGRPSTYAPTISTIQDRWYVIKDERPGMRQSYKVATLHGDKLSRSTKEKTIGAWWGKLMPTDIGMVVTDFLMKYFDRVLDYQFTAKIEEEFDVIAEGKLERHKMIRKFYEPFHTQVVHVGDTAQRESGERVLGKDPKTWKVVKVRIGRYWPLVQIGEADDEDKKLAWLKWGASIATITLEEALQAFNLPRHLGEREWEKVVASEWRFGPYVQCWSLFASLKHPDEPMSVSLERSIELLEARREQVAKKRILSFEYEGSVCDVQKWKRWPFAVWKRKRIKLPKDLELTEANIQHYLSTATPSRWKKKWSTDGVSVKTKKSGKRKISKKSSGWSVKPSAKTNAVQKSVSTTKTQKPTKRETGSSTKKASPRKSAMVRSGSKTKTVSKKTTKK